MVSLLVSFGIYMHMKFNLRRKIIPYKLFILKSIDEIKFSGWGFFENGSDLCLPFLIWRSLKNLL